MGWAVIVPYGVMIVYILRVLKTTKLFIIIKLVLITQQLYNSGG